MLDDKELQRIREELEYCQKPLFFFHDDPDGLCSFLLLYRMIREGNGVIVKAIPKLDKRFLNKVEEHRPDKIFVLDIAVVEQEFVDEANVPVVWIDHHEPLDLNKVTYFNPRLKGSSEPVTYLCHEVVKDDMWIAAIGCIGDWFIPPFYKEFCRKYPDLADPKLKNPDDVLFGTKLGKLARIFSFVLKGRLSEAKKCVKILSRIDSPYEILEKKTAAARYLMKRYKEINDKYEDILNDVLGKKHDEIVYYTYREDKTSFTGDLANELLHRFPDKIIIIAREKNGEMRMSLRSKNIEIRPILEKALAGIEGYGGGHEHACGACVKKEDIRQFMDNIRLELKQSS